MTTIGASEQSLSDVPVAVDGLTGAVAVAAGEEHSLALLSDGVVMAWGDNGFYQLARPVGFPSGVTSSDVPLEVEGLEPATAIAAGALFSLAITTGGAVQGWGDNAFGQLGNGTTTTQEAPVTAQGVTGARAIAAAGPAALVVTGSEGAVAGTTTGVTAGGTRGTGPISSIWRVKSTPNPAQPGGDGLLDDSLVAVSAGSSSDAWAVGGSSDSAVSVPLAEHWDGTSWTSVPVPLPSGATSGQLSGVDTVSPVDAWAVGTVGGNRTLIEHWDGTSWAVVPSPDPELGPGEDDELSAVAGDGPDDLWAVGFYSSLTFDAVLLEHWDGTSWVFVPPPVESGFQFGRAVSVVSADNVWVVGEQGLGPSVLTLHWNGSVWKEIKAPEPMDGKAPGNLLTGVAGMAAGDVWASGYEFNANQENLRVPYLEHWTGTSWAVVKVPNPGTEGSQLQAVAAVTATDVWVDGTSYQTDGAELALTEHFNGAAWSVAPSLDPGQEDALPSNGLSGITALRTGALIAVGFHFPFKGCCTMTLAERASRPGP